MSVPYTLTDRSLTLVVDNMPYSIPRSHTNWDKLITALNDNAPEADISPLLNVAAAVATFMEGAVEIEGRTLSLKGRPLDTHLTRRILQHMDAGLEGLVAPLVALLVNTEENPSYRAVQGLYEWLEKSNLPITEDGQIIAYKIVREDYLDIKTRTFDHSVGKIVEQPRNQCDEDPDRTCSAGLHFCSAEYLPHYGTEPGNRVVIVKVHPRDVVAFPKDYGTAKGRACRLEVIGEVERDVAADIFGANLVYVEVEDEVEVEVEEVVAETIRLAVGQTWKRRDGREVTIINETGQSNWPFVCNLGYSYSPLGNYYYSEDDLDLVELVSEVEEVVAVAIGQKWKRRDGVVVEITDFREHDENYPYWCSEGSSYTAKGDYYGPDGEHFLDLIELVSA